ncbi:MAG: leucine-rich repeat domain-containing protein [Flavobacteriales bacterium]|nr:leucine-rich repeat domain-containing protein [Flavobacteriales bacterium]
MTDSILSDKDIDSLKKLFYSGSDANDFLAFEILKKHPLPESFFGLLVCVAMTNKSITNDMLAYLDSSLNKIQKDIIIRTSTEVDMRLTLSQAYYQRDHKLEFNSKDALDIYHAHFLRRGESLRDFLIYDDGSHPDRKLAFDKLMKEELYWYNFSIPGLLYDEMETFAQKIISGNSRSSFYRLGLHGLKSNRIPSSIKTKKFESIAISMHHSYNEFPDFIFDFQSPKKLSIALNESSKIPSDWSTFSELTEIEFTGEGYIFDDFDFIQSLPKLKSIRIPYHKVESPNSLIAKKTIPIANRLQYATLEGYEISPKLEQKTINRIASAVGKSILSEDEKRKYFQLLVSVHDLKKLHQLSFNDLLHLLNINHKDLSSVLSGHIDKLSKSGAESLNKKSLLYIAGTPRKKKSEIKKKLSELNITLTNKPDDKITHVVLAKAPKEYKSLVGRDLTLVSEQDLYDNFKKEAPGFIEEAVKAGDTELNDNLHQLLFNEDPSNVAIGLEMIKGSGVHEELVDTLLVVYKTCSDAKMRGEAKKLLVQNAPEEYLPLINDAQRFTGLEKVKAQDINKKLRKIAKNSSRELAAKMSLLLHWRYKKGLRYILYHFKKPCEQRSLALKAMMEGTHLNFASGLGFTTWHGRDLDDITFYNMTTPVPFPIDVVESIEKIESANFHNCKFKSLPKNVGELKDLKELDLSFNFLGSIPKSIQNMTKLEHLDLRANQFKSFPESLRGLTNLKTLDLRHNNIMDPKAEPLSIPEDIRSDLKNCNILV